MNYWSSLDIIQQVAAELGLEVPAAIPEPGVIQTTQLVALLNSAGNELNTYYPWEQFVKTWEFDTVDGQEEYDLPEDWKYFIDQTQWDATNRWPLMGPKSAQEWAWMKSGLVAGFPRMRYRVFQNKLKLFPTPGSSSFHMRMEYIRSTWLTNATVPGELVTTGGDVLEYDPWMLIKYVKLKFYELKGFATASVQSDFVRIFTALTGKDKGAPVLNLSPRFQPIFVGPWSVPDGSWNVGP